MDDADSAGSARLGEADEKGSRIRRTALEADAFAGPDLRAWRGLFAPGSLWDGSSHQRQSVLTLDTDVSRLKRYFDQKDACRLQAHSHRQLHGTPSQSRRGSLTRSGTSSWFRHSTPSIAMTWRRTQDSSCYKSAGCGAALVTAPLAGQSPRGPTPSSVGQVQGKKSIWHASKLDGG